MIYRNDISIKFDYDLGEKMLTNPTFIKVVIGVAYGIILGIISIPLSKRLTLRRTEDPVKAAVLDKTGFKIASVLVGIAASVGITLTTPDTAEMIRNLALLIPIASIAIVDSLVRKIPNPLLLVMIIIQFVYLTYSSVSSHDFQIFLTAILGFVIGFAACTVPSILRIPVGSGDIKYSAVIGLCIYFSGYIQAMVIMGITAVICLLYLKISKKGGLKTLIPMGPLISIGTVITMCYPFIEKIFDVESIL